MSQKHYYKKNSAKKIPASILDSPIYQIKYMLFEENGNRYLVSYVGNSDQLVLLGEDGSCYVYQLEKRNNMSLTLREALDSYLDIEEVDFIYFKETFEEAINCLMKYE